MDSGGSNLVLPPQTGELEGITISEWIASRLWVDYGTPFTFEGRPYLKKIHDLEEKKILFRTGRQVEKSVRLHSRVLMADGSWKVAGEVRVGDRVASFDEKTQRMTVGPVTWVSGIYKKNCRRITTAFGHVAEIADTHPPWTGKGWVPAGDLYVGERVAVVREFGEFGKAEISDDRIAITAFLIGDGSIHDTTTFTQKPGVRLDDFEARLTRVGGRRGTSMDRRSGCVSVRVGGVIHGWMRVDGLSGKYSHEKFVPSWVYRLPREKTALFLNRLWSTDGHVKKNSGSKYSIEYCSMSQALVRDVRSLLWKFGIPSSVRRNRPSVYKKRGEERYAHILRIVTADGVRRFLTEIGALGKSEDVPLPDAPENNNRDTLPIEVNVLIKQCAPDMKGCTLPNWNKGSSTAVLHREGLRRSLKYPPTHEKLRAYLDELRQTAIDTDAFRVLETYASKDILWDKVRKIDDLGEQDCCDFTVEGTHSYIVEGLITHNTSSLAAKLVSWSCLRPNWKSLYVSPSQNQTRVFSHARLDRVLNSPYVRAKYFDPQKGIDFVYEKELMNGSTVLLNYCSTEADRCVAIDTRVLRADGQWVTIEQLIQGKEYGTELVTFSEKRNRLSTGKITQFHLNGRRRVGRLVLEGGHELRCTPDHKVWTQAMRWVQAEKVGLNRIPGSKAKRVAVWHNGGISWVQAVNFEDCGEIEVVDMTMSNDYSYIADGIVVHNCRGISADMLLADEIQDMTHDVFPVLEEVLSHSPHGYKIYAGTPKTLNNAMETHWKNSTQCEWLVWCSCGKWIFQDEKMIRKNGPTCPECGTAVDPQFGKWVPYGPEDAEFMGFRIPQTMVPWISGIPYKWKELLQKLEKWPQQQFYNEVLGLAHEKGANPVSESDIKKCCGSRQILEHKPVDMYFDALYAGVDWGAGLGSYTVLTIGGWSGGKFHVVYMKRFVHEKDEPGEQVQLIANTAARFDCPLVGCDWGGGYAQNSELSLLLTGKSDVIQLYESGVKKRNIDYQKKSRMYTFNRNMGLAQLFLAIKRQEIVFPRWEDTSEFAEDITCIFEDYNRTLRMLVYDHPEKMPDDTAHSLVFCMCSWKVARGDKAL